MDKKATVDPIRLAELMWPNVSFYREQREIIRSVVENDETYVVAGNKLGKDFVAGFLVVYFFLTRNPCRVVTTSAKDDHLRVLWGEVGNFIASSRYPLETKRGGPLILKHHDIRRVVEDRVCSISYVTGLVANKDSIAAMQGHHVANTGDGIPKTLFMCDESSSVNDDYYKMASTWADRMLIFGNPWECNNFFKRGVKGGNLKRLNGEGYIRKVIRIRAVDSPNVRLGLAQARAKKEITDEVLVPGVKTYGEYLKNRLTWDKIQQTVSLDAEFYEGAEVLLFPPEWLVKSGDRAKELDRGRDKREGRRRTMGVDPAEGGDSTVWTIVDELGIVKQVSQKTPDTSVIVGETIGLMNGYGVKPTEVYFDRGGGGKQHADQLKVKGYNVKTVAFGESVVPPPKRGLTTIPHRIEQLEERYTFKNRRAEMYGLLSTLVDPSTVNPTVVRKLDKTKKEEEETSVFAIPEEYEELRRQLGLIPKLYDGEGRLYLPSKHRRTRDSSEETLTEILGCSPDEADSLVLATYGLFRRVRRPLVG